MTGDNTSTKLRPGEALPGDALPAEERPSTLRVVGQPAPDDALPPGAGSAAQPVDGQELERGCSWPRPGLGRAIWALARKDLLAELRGRVAINTLGLFAVTTVVLVSFRLGPLGLSRDAGSVATLAVLLWIAIFFAAMTGMARSFVVEEEGGTAPLLRLAAPPNAVLLGKLLFNVLLLATLEALVTLLFVVLMGLRVANPALLAAVLVLGGLGLGVATTIIAALVARTTARGALFTVLAFPLLLPLLVVAVGATELALRGAGWERAWPDLRVLGAYAVALFAAALLLFEQVWEA